MAATIGSKRKSNTLIFAIFSASLNSSFSLKYEGIERIALFIGK
jgi:hypothetical protein